MANKQRAHSVGNDALEIEDADQGAFPNVRCDVSHHGMLMLFSGLERLGVLISGTKGFLLYRQTAEGLRLLGDYYATIPAAVAALLREGRW